MAISKTPGANGNVLASLKTCAFTTSSTRISAKSSRTAFTTRSGNEAWVSVGVDHDTAEFAVATLERCGREMGRKAYPDATELLVTADGGGSNAPRSRLWRVELQRFADATGLDINVCHFPPGTSKWNKIEHRLLPQITQNWRGRPLVSREAVVELIRGTDDHFAGLRVRARLDKREYEIGKDVSSDALRAVRLERRSFVASGTMRSDPESGTDNFDLGS